MPGAVRSSAKRRRMREAKGLRDSEEEERASTTVTVATGSTAGNQSSYQRE